MKGNYRNEVIAAFEKTPLVSEVARQLGVSRMTVYDYLKDSVPDFREIAKDYREKMKIAKMENAKYEREKNRRNRIMHGVETTVAMSESYKLFRRYAQFIKSSGITEDDFPYPLYKECVGINGSFSVRRKDKSKKMSSNNFEVVRNPNKVNRSE